MANKSDLPKTILCPQCGTLSFAIERGTYFRLLGAGAGFCNIKRKPVSYGVICGSDRCQNTTHGKHTTEAAAVKAFLAKSNLSAEDAPQAKHSAAARKDGTPSERTGHEEPPRLGCEKRDPETYHPNLDGPAEPIGLAMEVRP